MNLITFPGGREFFHQPQHQVATYVRQYREHIRLIRALEDMNRMDRINPKAAALEFARESEEIRGYSPADLPEHEKDISLVRDQAIRRFKVHVTIAEACLTSYADRMMHPLIINDELHGNQQTAWREGSVSVMRVIQPSGKHVRALTDFWVALADKGATQVSWRSENDRIAFAWLMHDLFICIEPFKSANERTARLLLQVMRRMLNLPGLFVRKDDMPFHEMRVNLFRMNIFMPEMRRLGYL